MFNIHSITLVSFGLKALCLILTGMLWIFSISSLNILIINYTTQVIGISSQVWEFME